MEDKTNELAKRILQRCSTGEMSEQDIRSMIKWHWDEAAKVVKNINQTSLDDKDRFMRLVEFEKQFGLSKTYVV